ncbi:hypothetical protein ACGFX4_39465 [Kitasatospora sp. NPDC048365]|uniref:hypothetical protein n=1 Tax=Kitasatospora sp. NPDC048365 TaxID=3364050 RepID=UPI0037149ED3
MSSTLHRAARQPADGGPDPEQYRPGRTVTDWDPEDPVFWRSVGRRVATRNLWIAVPALLVAFVVWQVWSVTATGLQDVGFGLTTSQLFWLTAVPGLTGGTARILYTFLGPRIGQRRFTALSTLVLVVPLLWLGIAIQDTSTPYAVLVAIAALCGFGGANFSSSLANIGFFFPTREKGGAAGIGNGSTFRQIPVIFRSRHLRGLAEGTAAHDQALKQAETESGAVTGFTAGIAAYGFFFIPAMFANFAVTSAMWGFVAFYASCLAITWWYYARRGAAYPS